jgi:hypothetical protein
MSKRSKIVGACICLQYAAAKAKHAWAHLIRFQARVLGNPGQLPVVYAHSEVFAMWKEFHRLPLTFWQGMKYLLRMKHKPSLLTGNRCRLYQEESN